MAVWPFRKKRELYFATQAERSLDGAIREEIAQGGRLKSRTETNAMIIHGRRWGRRGERAVALETGVDGSVRRTRFDLSNREQALADAERALELDPDLASARFIAEHLRSGGRWSVEWTVGG